MEDQRSLKRRSRRPRPRLPWLDHHHRRLRARPQRRDRRSLGNTSGWQGPWKAGNLDRARSEARILNREQTQPSQFFTILYTN